LRSASGDMTLTHVRIHADQMTVPGATVRALIAEQFPQWQALPVRRIASQGTVNAIFRIGDDLAARFPLRAGDAGATRRWLQTEAAAARELAGRTR
jgi:aminoglycoside phosphotransferase (APT) family kinase protein